MKKKMFICLLMGFFAMGLSAVAQDATAKPEVRNWTMTHGAQHTGTFLKMGTAPNGAQLVYIKTATHPEMGLMIEMLSDEDVAYLKAKGLMK